MTKFQNKFQDYNLSQENNAKIDNLYRRMLLMGITIIEHEDLVFWLLYFHRTPDLAMFRYNKQNAKLLKKMQAPASVS